MATVDLAELRVYQLAMRVGEEVWSVVDEWNWMGKQTVGLQWIRAADSIAANISEGYGRYSFKENAKFCYYARGSLRESQTWLMKARNRKLVQEPTAEEMSLRFETLRRQLDNYIHSLGKTGPNMLCEGDADISFDGELPSLEDLVAAHEPNS